MQRSYLHLDKYSRTVTLYSFSALILCIYFVCLFGRLDVRREKNDRSSRKKRTTTTNANFIPVRTLSNSLFIYIHFLLPEMRRRRRRRTGEKVRQFFRVFLSFFRCSSNKTHTQRTHTHTTTKVERERDYSQIYERIILKMRNVYFWRFCLSCSNLVAIKKWQLIKLDACISHFDFKA